LHALSWWGLRVHHRLRHSTPACVGNEAAPQVVEPDDFDVSFGVTSLCDRRWLSFDDAASVGRRDRADNASFRPPAAPHDPPSGREARRPHGCCDRWETRDVDRGARPSRRNVESDATATLNQPDDEDDQRQHQQDVKQSTHRVGSEQAHYPQHQEKNRQGPQHCATSLSRDKLPCRRIAAPDWAFDGNGCDDCAEQRLSVTTLFCSNSLLDREGVQLHVAEGALGLAELKCPRFAAASTARNGRTASMCAVLAWLGDARCTV